MANRISRDNAQYNIEYVSANTLAKVFETTPSTIWRWAKSGRLPAPLKLGEGTTRWNLAEVQKALAELAELGS